MNCHIAESAAMMGLVASPEVLSDGEQVVLRTRQHGKTMAVPSAILILIVGVASAVMLALPPGTGHLAVIRLAMAAAAVVALYWEEGAGVGAVRIREVWPKPSPWRWAPVPGR